MSSTLDSARTVEAHRGTSSVSVQREKLAAVLGPKRQRAKPVAPQSRPGTRATRPTPATSAARVTPAAASGRIVPSRIDGVALNADGHLADPKQWNDAIATEIAATLGITLDDARWTLVRFARAEFEAKGSAPNIRRITQGAQVSTKDVYALFPNAPGRTIAKIAGVPKPVGCI